MDRVYLIQTFFYKHNEILPSIVISKKTYPNVNDNCQT